MPWLNYSLFFVTSFLVSGFSAQPAGLPCDRHMQLRGSSDAFHLIVLELHRHAAVR